MSASFLDKTYSLSHYFSFMNSSSQSWIEKLQENPKPLYVAILVLLIPAVFYNLGLMPLIADEGIRATVALEMIFSGDYLTPRLGDVYYQNKPPLYNWFIALGFGLTGKYDEFSLRLVMTIFMFLFMGAIYYLTKKEVGKKIAFISALAFFTCGRVLTYDSMLGLIDICFSGFIFVMFILIYRSGKAEKYWQLFFSVYLLTVLTFMMKGLPAIAFVGISLIAYFIYQKKFKLLFSPAHILAGLSCVVLIAGYYYLYFQQNPDRTFEDVFKTLYSESSQRTVIENSVWTTLKGFIQFPIDYLYAFLPWTLFGLALFSKDARQKIKEHEFLRVMIVLFLANIVLYWLSPKNHPRYLFMFVPISTMVFVYAHENLRGSKWVSFIESGLMGILGILTLGTLGLPFLKQTQDFTLIWLITILLFGSLGICIWLYHKVEKQRLVILILFLLIVRIGFNHIVLPTRYESSDVVTRVAQAKELGEMARNRNLFIYAEPPRRYFHGEQVLNARTLFYISANTHQAVVHKKDDFKKGDWVILPPDTEFPFPAEQVFLLPSYRWKYPVMEVK